MALTEQKDPHLRENLRRRRILDSLFEAHRQGLPGVERRQLAAALSLPPQEIRRLLEYLSDPDKDFVSLWTIQDGNRIFHYARITTRGIDLIVSPEKFPTKDRVAQQLIQIGKMHGDIVGGDKITVGDNAKGVAAGRGAKATVNEGKVFRYSDTLLTALEEIAPEILQQLLQRLATSDQVEDEFLQYIKAWQEKD